MIKLMGKNKDKKESFNLFQFLFGSLTVDIILALNTAVFYFMYYVPKGNENIQPFIMYPGNLINGKVWCVITSGFIHGSLSHFLWNMFGVFIFGKIVEKKLGVRKTLFIYFGALTISMLFSTMVYVFLLHKNVAIIGASGAVMGLISGAMLLSPFTITYEMILPIPTMVKGWMFFYADIQGFLNQASDGVSHLAHIFGFLSIAVLVYFLSHKDKKAMKVGMLINIFSIIVLLLLNHWLANNTHWNILPQGII
ncbi:MAG: hypothetical protein A2Y06_00020 [Omnitrophica WOR_2 bacterium GWA2_37_7]|nr:MAG: hypothetical protein A2Y06_00020 [Omnitrophica WOR_2 bacterium GWA2_37_7]